MPIRTKTNLPIDTYAAVTILLIILLSMGGCNSDSSDEPSSGDGSIAVSIQWKGDTQKSAGAAPPQLSCTDLNLTTIQVMVYDQDEKLIAGSALWPCEEHSGTLDNVETGSNYTVVILGRASDQESDPVTLHGQRPEITVTKGETSTVDVEVQTFVPKPTGSSGICNNIVLECETMPGAQNYEFSISHNSDMSESSTHTIAENRFAPSDLVNNVTYYWQVKALDAYGNASPGSEAGKFTTGGAHLVKNINAGTLGSDPENMIVINNHLYFTAMDETGKHLWRYDGSEPRKIKLDGADKFSIREIIEFQEKVYFVAYDDNDDEIWTVDGDTAYKIDINSTGKGGPRGLTVFQKHLYFSADSNSNEEEEEYQLYKFDGSSHSPIEIGQVRPSKYYNSLVVDNALYFSCDSSKGRELCKWDGQNITVFDINTEGNSDPTKLTAVENRLYFEAEDSSGDKELYLHEGQSEQPVKIDVCEGGCSSLPEHLTGFRGVLYFSGTNNDGDTDLFMYPGEDAKAVNLNINPNGDSTPAEFAVIDNVLYLSATVDGTGREPYYLYHHKTAHGPIDIEKGVRDSHPSSFCGLKDRIYYLARRDGGREYVWDLLSFHKTRHDTSAVGTCPGMECPNNPKHLNIFEFNGEPTLFFSADNYHNGRELWSISGSGTPHQLIDVNKTASGTRSPSGIAEANGKIYFNAYDIENGWALWESDGMDKGTRFVGAINSDPFKCPTSNFIGFDEKLYFIDWNPDFEKCKLYVYDGNATSMVEIGDGDGWSTKVTAIFNGKLYFSAGGLWIYDGKTNPTKIPNGPLPESYGVYEVTYVAGQIYFTAGAAEELYKYNGKVVTQINVNNSAQDRSYVEQLTPVGKSLFFVAYDQERQQHLYYYDGVFLEKVKTNQNGDSRPNGLIESNGSLYFKASDGNRENLYVYANGSPVKVEVDAGSDHKIQEIFSSHGTLYFVVKGNSHSSMEFELWKSIDPSQAAIKIKELKDYGSRGDFYRLVSIVELNGKTYFSFYQSYTGVDSGTTAADIWETDGTTENTTLLFDVTPQHLTTFIPELIAKDDALYYIFYDTQFGPDIRRYCP